MSGMRNHGADGFLGNVGLKPKAPTRQQISEVEQMMEASAASVAHLGEGVRAVALAAQALVLDSGLKLEAVAVLLQHKLGKGPGGKPKYSIQTLVDIIHGLVGLEDFTQKPRSSR